MNFCRQILRQGFPQSTDPDREKLVEWVVWYAKNAVKFLLPEGGRILDDKDFRGIGDDDVLHLPYPHIALEYARGDGELLPGQDLVSKAVVFASEMENGFQVLPVNYAPRWGLWIPFPAIAIPKKNAVRREVRHDGWAAIAFHTMDSYISGDDYTDEAGALLSFLSALACSNVAVETLPRRKNRKGKRLDPWPFDEYHVLTIPRTKGGELEHGGTHRSPREHLRRGHIRRIDQSRKVWINSTIVNAGKGGVVSKDYNVKPGTPRRR